MALEAVMHAETAFVTLTYNQENIPDAGSLFPRDLQLWLKRLRQGRAAIRFYAVGEYGDETWRPHYHVALFGCGRGDGDKIHDTWGKGFTDTGDLTLASASYIAQYVTKKMTSKDDTRLQGRHPEFARMSLRPGIGAPVTQSVAESLSSAGGQRYIDSQGDVPSVLRTSGRVMPLGRYMRDRIRRGVGHKFISENPTRAFNKTAEMLALYGDYVRTTKTPLSRTEWEKARDAQKVLNLEARMRPNGGKL